MKASTPARMSSSASRASAALLTAAAGWGLLMAPLSAFAIDVRRADVKAFIDEIAAKDNFSKRSLRGLLRDARTQPKILLAMERPAEKAKPWYEYRGIFITEKRINQGTEFWLAHRRELDRASVQTGVPPEYIAAIVGVETFYGGQTGVYRVIDALSTLAFDFPARGKYFRDELEQYLLLTRDMHFDPLLPKGSYAGAMGAPQFMPTAYRRYAVDADQNGRIDLWNNWDDVCASVGNYLKEYGWNEGDAVLSEATAAPDKPDDLDGRKLALSDTVNSLKEHGIVFDSQLPGDAPALLIAADEADGVRWRVGYNNFYVITRYNHSMLYAMAVFELANAVKQRVLERDPLLPKAAQSMPSGLKSP